jgi:penicillin amidase
VEGRTVLRGLAAPVEVVRDRWGVPHLFARNEKDLFFAQGYVHAQDRLWQMHFNRTVGSGRLGSLLGPGPAKADAYLRTVGLRRAAERDLARLSPETRALLEAYAAGVNAFLGSHRGRLPIEFSLAHIEPEPWTPVDSLVWTRMLSFNLSLNSRTEITRSELIETLGEPAVRQLLPPYPADGPVIVPSPPAATPGVATLGVRAAQPTLAWFPPGLTHPEEIWGSNAWAVHGSRTATGRPLLANDTHLPLGMPSVWYEIGLHGGRFDTEGFSFPGMPFVVEGQNRRIAWGVTSLNGDVQDLYVEKLDDPKHPQRYLYKGKWVALDRVREEIPIRGRKPMVLEVLSTRHGPLIDQVLPVKQKRPLALRWAASEGSRMMDALNALDRAASWQEFRAALSQWDLPSLNFVYADADGNIGYQATARLPLRAPGHDGTVPVPGWTGEFEWLGTIPFDEMPSAFNPPAGYVATANHKVTGDSYPYVLTRDWPPPDRARRINALLAADPKVTMDDMKSMQQDTYCLEAERLLPYLLAVHPSAPVEKAAVERLRSWDRRFDTGSVGASIYQAWTDALLPEVFEDDMGRAPALQAARPLLFAQSEMVVALLARRDDPWFDDHRTPQVETRDDILQRSLTRAVALLQKRLGKDPGQWRWGRIHTVRLQQQPLGLLPVVGLLFNGPRVEAPGTGNTINSLGSDVNHPYQVRFGVSQRFLADLSDLSRSLAVNSSGQSALPFSRHRDDETQLWIRGEYHPVFTTRSSIQAESVLTLAPR